MKFFIIDNEPVKSTELTSVCIPYETSFIWTQQNIDYTVKGTNTKVKHSFENCFSNVIKTIENKINAPVELRDKEIYAFSFYFDRLNSAKLLKGIFVRKFKLIFKSIFFLIFYFNTDSSGGLIQIRDIFEKAKSGFNYNVP